MTVYARFMRRPPEVPTRIERWAMPDGYEVSVMRLEADLDAPRVILLHGLEGTRHSHYVQSVTREARQRGWGVDLLIFRTCDGRVRGARRSYHSGETGDLDAVVKRVVREHPRSPLALVGVSLGGNVALKWLGEQGEAVPQTLRSAVAISVPFDLARSSVRIDQGVSRLYSHHFLKSLRNKALVMLEAHPELASRGAITRARTLWAFDDAFTSKAHGFSDAADYYARASSLSFLSRIRIPTLLLSSRDDPFHPPSLLDDVAEVATGNEHLRMEFTDRGGHVGFLEGAVPFRARSYIPRRVGEFLSELLTR
jgi:predicted alpha/beta-fold hydrolase